jgi:magnesium chelatase subunit H
MHHFREKSQRQVNLTRPFRRYTQALKKAAENRKAVDPLSGAKRTVKVSVIEAFGSREDVPVQVVDLEDALRIEYRSKLLNPKWRDAMLKQGSGGAYEISQRMTAMVGWAATSKVDNFVFDQAAARYTLDEGVAKQLQQSNPEAFKNVRMPIPLSCTHVVTFALPLLSHRQSR